MTPTTLAAEPSRATDTKVIGLVGSAHFVSHVFCLVLPPVMPFLRAEMNVSYTELGLVMAVFNAISGVLQTPAGFLVDRTSARTVLVGGLLLGSAALAISVAMPNFLLFGLMFAVLGVVILSRLVASSTCRIGLAAGAGNDDRVWWWFVVRPRLGTDNGLGRGHHPTESNWHTSVARLQARPRVSMTRPNNALQRTRFARR